MSYDNNANAAYTSHQWLANNYANSIYNYGQPMVNTTGNYGAGPEGYNVNIGL